MKRKIVFAILVIIYGLSWNIQAWANNKTILVVGDSISTAYGMDIKDGWVALLQSKLAESGYIHEIMNASITGDVTASGRQRISKQLQLHSPEVIIIALGGNDGLRGLPIQDMRENLQSMIDDSVASGAKVLLAGMKILPNYGPRYTNDFARSYVDLSQHNNISLVPFILEGIGGVPEMMQADGIHPNEDAQPIIVDNVWPWLSELL